MDTTSSTTTTSTTTSTTINTTPDFVQDGWTLLSQGAEARVWRKDTIVCKERFPKTYRHPTLEERLHKARGRAEARILQRCADRNIPVPTVQSVQGSCIYMNYIHGGVTVRDHIHTLMRMMRRRQEPDRRLGEEVVLQQHYYHHLNQLESLAKVIGTLIAQLHNAGIIHGDLTTSNMMLMIGSSSLDPPPPPPPNICLIDFGLAKSHTSSEERAVDLYVLERAVSSTHPELPNSFLTGLLQTYVDVAEKPGKTNQQTVMQRLEQVRQRGRKRECFG